LLTGRISKLTGANFNLTQITTFPVNLIETGGKLGFDGRNERKNMYFLAKRKHAEESKLEPWS
jgi:hypothetical protein